MQQAVEDYLARVKAEEEQKAQAYRDKVLLETGVGPAREYSPDDKWTEGYPYFDAESNRYYREKPLEVTDEEWAAIKEAYETQQRVDENAAGGKGIVTLLRTIAVIVYIGGFVLGIVLGQTIDPWYGTASFSFGLALAYWLLAFISGSSFLGFAEVVRMLHVLANKK